MCVPPEGRSQTGLGEGRGVGSTAQAGETIPRQPVCSMWRIYDIITLRLKYTKTVKNLIFLPANLLLFASDFARITSKSLMGLFLKILKSEKSDLLTVACSLLKSGESSRLLFFKERQKRIAHSHSLK